MSSAMNEAKWNALSYDERREILRRYVWTEDDLIAYEAGLTWPLLLPSTQKRLAETGGRG